MKETVSTIKETPAEDFLEENPFFLHFSKMSSKCEFLGLYATRSINLLRLSNTKNSLEILAILVSKTDTAERGPAYP